MDAPRPTPAERAWLTGLAVAVIALGAGAARSGPDGEAALALVSHWHGLGPEPPDPGRWPPLWPALLWLGGWVLPLEEAALLLNLALAGLVAWPLYDLARRLGGRWAARAAVGVWALLPAVREHATVPDARPLSWLITTACAAATARAAAGRGPWWPAFTLAALGPLARPEGLALVPLVAVAALLVERPRWRAAGMALIALAPAGLSRALGWGVRGNWEAFYGPWAQVVPPEDFLALTGGAAAPTELRALLIRAHELGIERPALPLEAMAAYLPQGLEAMAGALIATMGLTLLATLAAGAWFLAKRSPGNGLALAMGASPLLVLAALPMTFAQASPSANLLFLVPAGLAVAGVGLGRLRMGGLLLAALALAEVHLSPLRPPPPDFFEDSDAARQMRIWLSDHPPDSGRVAVGLSGRGVIRRAGLEPLALPSGWQRWDPPRGTGALVSAVDLWGESGGRGRMLLEDPGWALRFASWDGGADWWAGRPPGELGAWMVYLEKE